ncbi:MAG: flagellar filament capping protein FliD [Proteobacteria bacterium]|nr:flagellar filament capping protein FliD [Pseudomonadota bacterium]MCP4921714.1 flagellar filament capping protein FliD [Pseudomonadota bacterium]
MPAVDGIASGLDTTGLIDAIVGAAEVPKIMLEADLADVEAHIDKVAEFKTKLSSLQTALEDIDSLEEFGDNAITLSDEGWIDVEVGAETPPGSYDIEVNELARSAMQISQGYNDSSSAGLLGAGDIIVEYAGGNETVAVDLTMTMEDVAEEIDALDGVSAYVMDTGDSSTPYRLVVMGDDTGAENTLMIDTSALTGGTSPGFSEVVAPQDAEIELNGITVYSATNEVNDAIPGMDITLTTTTTSPITATVTRDTDAITAKVEAFVDAYNSMHTFYNLNTDFDADEGIRGALFGDGTIRGIVDQLGNRVSDNYSADDYFGLGNIGINTKQSGNLEFDSTVFEEQLVENPEDVLALFADDEGFAKTVIADLDEVYLSDDGLIETRTETLEDTVESLEDAIDQIEERLENMEERLRSQFTYMETVLGSLQSTQSQLGALLGSSDD